MKPYIFVSTAHLSIIIRILTRSKVYDLFFVSLLPHILAPRGKQTLSFILYAKITFTFFPEKKTYLGVIIYFFIGVKMYEKMGCITVLMVNHIV